jgi:hypothetical protein
MNEDNLKHKKLLKYMSENVGISMSQAMKDLGYSESYSNSPDHIKKTKSWKKLMKKYLPDSKLVKVTKEGLNATMVKTSFTEQDKVLPDFAVRHKYLETALKMKGKLITKTDLTTKGEKIETNTIMFTDFKHDSKG